MKDEERLQHSYRMFLSNMRWMLPSSCASSRLQSTICLMCHVASLSDIVQGHVALTTLQALRSALLVNEVGRILVFLVWLSLHKKKLGNVPDICGP